MAKPQFVNDFQFKLKKMSDKQIKQVLKSANGNLGSEWLVACDTEYRKRKQETEIQRGSEKIAS